MLVGLKKLFSYNFKTLILFEGIFKLLTVLLFSPMFLKLFNLIMKITGYKYLTLDNLLDFATNPYTIVLIIILILLMAFYTLIDISTIIIIIDASYQQKKISIKESLKLSLKKSLKVLNIKNIWLPFLVLFLIPFLNIGITSSFINSISIPEFIMEYIQKNSFLNYLFIIVVLFLGFIFLRWIYSLHYFILEDCNFKESAKKSSKLGKRKNIHDFLVLVINQIMVILCYILTVVIGILLIIFINQILSKINIINSLLITIIWLFIAISLIIFMLLSTPISYAFISLLFYKNKKEKKEKIVHIQINEEISNVTKKKLKGKIILAIIILVSGTIFTSNLLKGKYNLNIEYLKEIKVTAHRGASLDYPENTMSAFLGAKEMGADWIELDVQMTKDGKIIVIHDKNLKRTTGIDKNTWELTYDEIKELDAGSFFKEEFKDEKIPLLEDVIKYAKSNFLNLNIELKPTGHEQDFEKKVIDLINEFNYTEQSVVASQDYEVLKKVKEYDKNITTVYVMSFAYGDIFTFDKADYFSIEESNVTKNLVQKIHNQGKEIYVWTINNEENIQKMIDINVDNIITDNVTLAKNLIYQNKTSNVISKYIKLVENLFK